MNRVTHPPHVWNGFGRELRRVIRWTDRHQRLLGRLLIAFALSSVVDLVGGLLAWRFEAHAKGTGIHSLGDALFFSSAQLLTVSSSLKNPVTGAGKILDLGLELWGVFVITAVAGAFAAFFRDEGSGKRSSR